MGEGNFTRNGGEAPHLEKYPPVDSSPHQIFIPPRPH